MAGNEAKYDEVKAFLDEFKAKAEVFGIVYNIDKEENQQTLFDLELFGSKRDEYILNLQPEDYYQGPDVNDYDSEEGTVWMSGCLDVWHWYKEKRQRKKDSDIHQNLYHQDSKHIDLLYIISYCKI